MAETLLEMQKQLDLQRVAIEEQRIQAERERIQQIEAGDPALQVSGAGVIGGPAGQVHSFLITNHRATAQRLKILVKITDDQTGSAYYFSKEVGNPLIKGVAHKLELAFEPGKELTSAACSGQMTILAERVDGLVSEFTFEAKGRLNFKRTGYRSAEPGLTLD
jgi:hypothetical protein